MTELMAIDLSQTALYVSAASICFNPLFWNIVARNEYYNRTMTRILGNRPQLGCYLLAATIFSLGLFRDYLYKLALESQPVSPLLVGPIPKLIGWACIAMGNIFVVSSTLKLGITGTFLGDYFGILMDAPVTSFPFNVVDNPMYHGSSLIFFGTALCMQRFAGFLLTGLVIIVYYGAIQFENPFTTMIYANRSINSTKIESNNNRPKIKKLN